ncbi:MAG: N-acetylmuramic acid 6-phosphate etherase [Planctomycetes bacterium]|nr:N-acetylmuramic acid 6-phosphate etherase [Planctomycetota bacterium]
MKTKPVASSPRGHLLTEQRNPATVNLDQLSVAAAFDIMNREDQSVARAVGRAKPAIVAAVRRVVAAWRRGGRLIYIGAGTSGRLGVLDASECPPTFRSDPSMVRGIIAGGKKALWRSVEGAEDVEADGRRAMREMRVSKHDVVMGIAAGGTTPYVHAAIAEARRRGATTIFLACVPKSQASIQCDVDIRVLTGPELVSGSTRLKAGTATKLVLNTITTLGMVQLGKTYGNLMVDLNSYACRKLVDRATRVVQSLTSLDRDSAATQLHAARGKVKTALIMHHRGIGRAEAEKVLAESGGRVREAMIASKPQGLRSRRRRRQ